MITDNKTQKKIFMDARVVVIVGGLRLLEHTIASFVKDIHDTQPATANIEEIEKAVKDTCEDILTQIKSTKLFSLEEDK